MHLTLKLRCLDSDGCLKKVHESFGDYLDPKPFPENEWFLCFEESDLWDDTQEGRDITKTATRFYDNLCNALGVSELEASEWQTGG